MSLLLLGATTIVHLGMWGGTAGPWTYLRGQMRPRLRIPPPGTPPRTPPRTARLAVDTSTVVVRVSPRYLSFAIDTSQLVGGNWWDPRAEKKERGTGEVPSVVFDFDRLRLGPLVRALEPAFLRVGGSEADKLYYDLEGALRVPPMGYDSLLHAERWAALARFVAQHDLELVFTLNAGPSTRDASGVWRADNAEQLLRHASARGDQIAKIELGNEANLYWYVFGPWRAPSARQLGADVALAKQVARRFFPGIGVTGPSSAYWPVIGEPITMVYALQEQYVEAAGPHLDHVAWHYYPQQSRRCLTASRRAHPARLLEPDHLDEVAIYADWNATWRDRHAPGRKLWLGETGNAQCGGEPGVSDRFIASLWWLDQLGLLARHHHWVVVRQTLSGSDYGMLSEPELEIRPDYWASVLWKRFMGRRVLRADSDDRRVRAYAHCSPPGLAPVGSVTVLAINLDPERAAILELDREARSWRIDAPDVLGRTVRLNGQPLEVTTSTSGAIRLPALGAGGEARASPRLPPTSYGFYVLDRVSPACGATD